MRGCIEIIAFDKLLDLMEGLIKKDRQNIHTTALGEIVSFNPSTMRADVFLLENVKFKDQYYPSTTIVNCPVAYPNSKDFYIRVPYSAGDKVVVSFCESNIAEILMTGGRTNQTMSRRHSEDDAVVIGGWSSDGGTISSSNGGDLVIEAKSSGAKIILTPDGELIFENIKKITGNANEGVEFTSPTFKITGNLEVSQGIKSTTMEAKSSLKVDGKEQNKHVHISGDKGEDTSPPK